MPFQTETQKSQIIAIFVIHLGSCLEFRLWMQKLLNRHTHTHVHSYDINVCLHANNNFMSCQPCFLVEIQLARFSNAQGQIVLA